MSFVIDQRGSMISMDDNAMTELGLQPGQTVDDEKIHDCIAANARALCRYIETEGIGTDLTELSALCGHKPLS